MYEILRFYDSPDYGLRISLDVEELIFHEISGTKTSQRVLQTIKISGLVRVKSKLLATLL